MKRIQFRLGRYMIRWLGWRDAGFWLNTFRYRANPERLQISCGLGLIAFYAGEKPNA